MTTAPETTSLPGSAPSGAAGTGAGGACGSERSRRVTGAPSTIPSGAYMPMRRCSCMCAANDPSG